MDADLAYALQLNEEINNKVESTTVHLKDRPSNSIINSNHSIIDNQWELIDPVPNIHDLFIQFNKEYFDGLLASVEVKWSSKMTLCAGLCCYEGRGGLCCIKLSEPLLKLRPRSDLINTLLHEMIHALLFVTANNKDRDGHGPEFHKHMNRINKVSGSKITVYHDFYDEVDSYRQHWWRCNGPCVKRPPFYGILRRAINRAPSFRDPWFKDHHLKCGGTFIKIREPEQKVTKAKNVNNGNTSKEDNKFQKNTKPITSWLVKENPEQSGIPLEKHKSPHSHDPNQMLFESGKIKQSNPIHSRSTGISSIKLNANHENSSGKQQDINLIREKFLKRLEGNISSTKKRKSDSDSGKNISLKKTLKHVNTNMDTHTSFDEHQKSVNSTNHSFHDKSSVSYQRATKDTTIDNVVKETFNKQCDDNLVECPACPAKIPEKLLNIHLDTCLS